MPFEDLDDEQADDGGDGFGEAADALDDTLGGGHDDANAQNKRNAQNDRNAQNNNNAQKAQKAQSVTNVKNEWNVRSFYLDDDLDDRVRRQYKRLDYELDGLDAVDGAFKKTRHFYPLLIEVGLTRLEELDAEDIAKILRERHPR
jgi:acetyl-CoA acetyltransferase